MPSKSRSSEFDVSAILLPVLLPKAIFSVVRQRFRNHLPPYTRKASPFLNRPFAFGAGDQDRTGDLDVGNVTLYQLSYTCFVFLSDPLQDPNCQPKEITAE